MAQKIIKVRIPAQTVEIDLNQWALAYGIDPKVEAVREDVKAYFANQCAEYVAALGLGRN